MPLTNKQYDTIMREYDRRQYQDYRLQCTRDRSDLRTDPQDP